MFCEIVIALDGYAEAGGMPVPKSHRGGAPLSGGTFRALPRRMTAFTP